MLAAERRYGPEAVWPYFYAGTMGLVMRDGINRLRHAKRYSGMYATFCTTLAWTGFIAGTAKLTGADPREMAKSDLVVIWGTNPVNTQVNVMTHATRARKERGAKIVAIDIYKNGTMQQADLALCLRPGTDGALACAVMHVLFRDRLANWPYLEKYTDCPRELEAHLASRTPEWASAITGLSVDEIETFARMVGTTPRTFFRLGYGFSRSRNGASQHARRPVHPRRHRRVAPRGRRRVPQQRRHLSLEQIADRRPRRGRPERAHPRSVADRRRPDRRSPRHQGRPAGNGAPDPEYQSGAGGARAAQGEGGLRARGPFTCVHEQFMTATAEMADVVLPATMFLEHDDIYQGGGHQHILLGPKLVEPPGECRSNHEVIAELAKRVGAEHRGFAMSPREIIDWTLQNSGWGSLAELEAAKWIDCQPPFEKAHYLEGFGYPDKKFRFKPDWQNVPAPRANGIRVAADMPSLPDHWDVIEKADERHPFRLATSPSRDYLNSSFNEMPTSQARHGPPRVKMHPDDLADLGIAGGARVRMGNERGEIALEAEAFAGVQRGVVIVESIAPNAHFEGGEGINTLTSAVQAAPLRRRRLPRQSRVDRQGVGATARCDRGACSLSIQLLSCGCYSTATSCGIGQTQGEAECA